MFIADIIMIDIVVSEQLRSVCPHFAGVAVFADVINNAYNESLWQQIDGVVSDYKSLYSIEDIKKNPAIKATRDAYKKAGKDPNRYRPSSEALCRRILRELPLYQINTLVDIINLVSIKTGYSIGGFDRDKIKGDVLTLGIGMKDEPYEAIGRGILNIEGLPVYRDEAGGIGTPTSDEERTKLDIDTVRFLAIINGYSGSDGLAAAANLTISLLEEYTYCKNTGVVYF